MVVKVKDAETKRNKASVAHTGWKKRTKTSTTTPKKVCLYSSSLQSCNYFFNRKFANQRAIVQQENHIHRVTGLVVWRKEGWWEALLQSFSPLSRSYHVSFSLSFPSSPAYCTYFCSWLSPVSQLRSLLSLFSSYKSSCRLHKYERAFFGVVVCATLVLFPRCFSVFHLDNHGSWEHQRKFSLCSIPLVDLSA